MKARLLKKLIAESKENVGVFACTKIKSTGEKIKIFVVRKYDGDGFWCTMQDYSECTIVDTAKRFCDLARIEYIKKRVKELREEYDRPSKEKPKTFLDTENSGPLRVY